VANNVFFLYFFGEGFGKETPPLNLLQVFSDFAIEQNFEQNKH
jgi:hypothetical protein